MSEETLPRARHERSDVTFRFALLAFGGLLLGLICSALLSIWLFPHTLVDHRLPTALPSAPAPQLQSNPATELHDFVAKEKAWLNGSGWVDRAHGVAHIPIDRAMRQVARDGIPDWPTK